MNRGIISSLAIGAVAGATVGAVAMSMSNARGRRMVKQHARNAMHAVGGVVEDISGRMKR